ncbi:unnamed protein product [Lymnaea stagnalis]|uniref:Uncharacterized protein n=1 Tax=Lymnaea stagnalis TaxID=6523 RepID=A0AAV2HZ84_LYMST
MEDLSCNFKWLFSEEKLRNTPSVECGISMEQELTFRQKQAMLIQTIGLKSGLTQLAVNTSVIFMHRFYMFRTVKAFPRVQLALGFAFAGGKVEESARKLEHLIRTSIDIIRSNKNREFLDKSDPLTYDMDSQWRSKMDVLCQNNCNIESPAYQEMRKLVLECETEIYAVIGFQLQIVHPHNYVIRMCALLGAENIKDISQYAYNLATASSQLTMLCLKYKPETIATMCLNIASKAHSVKFVSMKDPNVKWYQVLHSLTDLAEIEAVSEEFLQLIKGCPLLPSWMTNLGRMSRVANSRAMPGPSRGPGASSASAPQGSRQGQVQSTSSSNTTSTAGSALHSSAAASNHPSRPVHQMGLLNSSSQSIETQQLVNSGSVQELVHSPTGRQPAAVDGAIISGSAPSDAMSRTHSSGGNSQMRPPSASSATATNLHHSQQQQHRSHASNNNGRPPSSTSSAPANSKPQSRHSLPSSSTQPPGTGRSSSQHSAPPATHLSSHTSSRQTHDPARLSLESVKPHDPLRSHESQRINHDPARSRDPSRSQDPARPTQRTDRRSEPGFDPKKSKSHPTTREEASALRHQQARSAAEFIHAQDLNTSPHTPPPISSPAVKIPSPVDPASESAYTVTASGDVPDYVRSTTPPDATVKADDGLPLAHASKLSLSMYRERASARSRVPTGSYEQNTPGEDNTAAIMAEDNLSFEPVPESALNSPADKSLKPNSSNSDLMNFNTPQTDSPNAPPLKIKVKLDPSGDRHYVKNTDSGLRLKIKKNRDVEAGPSSARSASRSNTPFEEGEIVDDSSPATVPGGSERKAEGLKIRLSVPKSGDSTGSYSRRDSDHSSNGYNGERESHRSHHHGHHRHNHKSKKHSSKHERSRHEGKSSKRSSSAADYHEERPSKSLRLESYSSETTHRSIHSDNSSSQTLQHQNSGFSINDAFSSTMPHNIFEDDEDDGSHAPPPITPTTDAVPAHHEKFHQMLARHRALCESSKPPLPKGLPPPPSPPPPPPSPPTL